MTKTKKKGLATPWDTHLNLVKLREKLGLPKNAVARYIGVSAPNYHLIEKGKQRLTIDQTVAFWVLMREHGIIMNLETLITGREGYPKHIDTEKITNLDHMLKDQSDNSQADHLPS